MSVLDDMIVTEIHTPQTVFSEKGNSFHMENRPSFGLSLCTGGQITYTMGGREYISDEGCAILLPQGGTYSLSRDKTGTFPLINFKCQPIDCDTIQVFPLKNPEVCLRQYDRVKSLSLFGGNRLRIFSAFYELLDSISKEQADKHGSLYPVVEYIKANFANAKLNNTELAKQAGISEVYLRKLFSAHYNTTPKQYILDVRIQKAKQLLIDTPYKITTVAEACGFSSPYHFCRAFKERTGLTPTQFTVQNRVSNI